VAESDELLIRLPIETRCGLSASNVN